MPYRLMRQDAQSHRGHLAKDLKDIVWMPCLQLMQSKIIRSVGNDLGLSRIILDTFTGEAVQIVRQVHHFSHIKLKL